MMYRAQARRVFLLLLIAGVAFLLFACQNWLISDVGRHFRARVASWSGYYDGCLCDQCFHLKLETFLDHYSFVHPNETWGLARRAFFAGTSLLIISWALYRRLKFLPTRLELATTVDHCGCGYSRFGLAAHAPCPECGTRSPMTPS